MRNCLERAAPARVPGREPSNLEPAHESANSGPARAPVSGSPATLHGGNCSIRAATRRRHAGRGLLMVQNPPSMTGPIRSRRRRPHPIDDGCVGVAGPQRRDMSHTRPSVPGADARCAENSPPGPIRGASGWSRITIGRLVAVGCSGTAARPPTTIERLSHDDARSPGHPL